MGKLNLLSILISIYQFSESSVHGSDSISRTPKCVRVDGAAPLFELVSTSTSAMIEGGGLVAARQLPPPYCDLHLEA